MITYTVGWLLALGVGIYVGWWVKGAVANYELKRALSLLSDDEKNAFFRAWTKGQSR